VADRRPSAACLRISVAKHHGGNGSAGAAAATSGVSWHQSGAAYRHQLAA